tara:strand:- start:15055 stop:15270 length:216 start_codon:yes stop_codon:yes gene_type:complete
MNLKIKFARPNLVQDSTYQFKVSNWTVIGRILVPEGECKCKEKDFDTFIDTDQLTLSEQEIKSLVIQKLGI